jgi:hypothetical protein
MQLESYAWNGAAEQEVAADEAWLEWSLAAELGVVRTTVGATGLAMMPATTLLFLLTAAAAPSTADATISVSLAIPSQDGTRRIAVGTPHTHFHVLLRNNLDTPQRIWDESFSWGYYALSVEIVGDDGAVSAIRKKKTDFTVNIPSSWMLGPGGSFVVDVYLGDRRKWEGVPLPGPACRTIRMRAVYEVIPGEESRRLRVWTGRVASSTETVELCQ